MLLTVSSFGEGLRLADGGFAFKRNPAAGRLSPCAAAQLLDVFFQWKCIRYGKKPD